MKGGLPRSTRCFSICYCAHAAGDLVDPGSAEGIRLKYQRKKEWAAAREKEALRKQSKLDKRAWLAGLAGSDVSPTTAVEKGDDDAASIPRLAGLISSVCEPYMGAYVRFERQTLDANVSQAMQEVGRADFF
jgi:hypothetical protein